MFPSDVCTHYKSYSIPVVWIYMFANAAKLFILALHTAKTVIIVRVCK